MSQRTSHFSPEVRHPKSHTAAPIQEFIDIRSASNAAIAKRAYEKYQARGFAHGFDREDWISASRELVAETFGHLSLSSSPSPGPSPSLSPNQHASQGALPDLR
jgi:hypothetical protein